MSITTGSMIFTTDELTGNGVWVSYHADMSELALFKGEIEALRYAVKASMKVAFVPFGKCIRETLQADS